MNYGVWALVALLIAAAVVELSRNPKRVLIGSFILWSVQHALLAISYGLRNGDDKSPYVRPLVLFACFLGGSASALAWTAQGVYFAFASRKHAGLTGMDLKSAMAYLAMLFVSLELVSEAMCRVGASVMITVMDLSGMGLLSGLCALGAIATCFADDLTEANTPTASALAATGPTESTPLSKEPKEKQKTIDVAAEPPTIKDAFANGLRAAGSSMYLLATSLTAILLLTFCVLKGVEEVYIADYVNGELTANTLGASNVGFLTAIGVAVGGISGVAFPYITPLTGRSTIMVAGILAWGLPALADLVLHAANAPGATTTMIILDYIGYGVGRAVFDSTFRVVCASLFPHRVEQIFALLRFGEGSAAFVVFNICPCEHGVPVRELVLALACISLACYALAEKLNGYGRLDVTGAPAVA